jgi:hypothetical protein
MAWQRAYERMIHAMLREGVDLQEIARAPMPSEIRDVDYVVGKQLQGGWLDLQEVLRGILHQGGLTINPLHRLRGVEEKALALLQADPDESLFCLFQALADDALGYCATHSLLCTVICELTASKLGYDAALRHSLRNAAMTMNIGMARDQDSMARQSGPISDWQRGLILNHPHIGANILQQLGMDDEDQLDLVRWHHSPQSEHALARNRDLRRILYMADAFVAKMAARRTRLALVPVKAVKSMVLGAQGDEVGVGSAMAQAVGFYPPGSYLQLIGGNIAVSVQRGARANTPWVVSIIDKDSMPLSRYVCQNTADMPNAIVTPVNPAKVKVAVNTEKIRRARERIAR